MVKNGETEKTIEHFGGKSCRSSGLLMWLTFRSLIAPRGAEMEDRLAA